MRSHRKPSEAIRSHQKQVALRRQAHGAPAEVVVHRRELGGKLEERGAVQAVDLHAYARHGAFNLVEGQEKGREGGRPASLELEVGGSWRCEGCWRLMGGAREMRGRCEGGAREVRGGASRLEVVHRARDEAGAEGLVHQDNVLTPDAPTREERTCERAGGGRWAVDERAGGGAREWEGGKRWATDEKE